MRHARYLLPNRRRSNFVRMGFFRIRDALVDLFFIAILLKALAEKRFAALIIDEIGTGRFPVLFHAGIAGGDGKAGTPDDPYVRLPGHAVSQPKAVKPLLGYNVHTPYIYARRK